MAERSEFEDMTWAELAIVEGKGRFSVGVEVEATRRSVDATDKLARIITWASWIMIVLTVVILGCSGWMTWWTYEMASYSHGKPLPAVAQPASSTPVEPK